MKGQDKKWCSFSKFPRYLLEPLRKCCTDTDPYVRKTAAICVAKVYEINPEEVEAQGFRAYMVPEVCGLNRDCRNFICVPSEQPLTDRLLVQSTVPVEAKSFDPGALMRVPIVRPESKT